MTLDLNPEAQGTPMTPTAPLRVLMATSWDTACGIADYAAQLRDAVQAADPGISIRPSALALDPLTLVGPKAYDLVFLNHHDGLHSRWLPEHVANLSKAGIPVVVTYHDTYGDKNSDKAHALAAVADAFISHEPLKDLPGARVVPMGVPAAARMPYRYGVNQNVNERLIGLDGHCFKAYQQQPVLGTVGFNFPWKNFDWIAEVSAACGWALVILSNNATEADEARWRAANPNLLCVRKFLPQEDAIAYLAGCDATIFAYECANAGVSGALRQGIAARKHVIAWADCRQFKELRHRNGGDAITWCSGFDRLPAILDRTLPHGCNSGVVNLAQRDSWASVGRTYAAIFRSVVR